MKKKRMVKPVLAVLLLTGLGFYGCKGPEQASEVETPTPYADDNLLCIFAGEGFVNYKVSRFFALEAMNNFSSHYSWEGASLSDKPVVIYNSLTEEPRFYEFRVIKDGKEVGAISCVANKKEGEPVRYILPYATPVQETVTRSLLNQNNKLIDTGYPSKIVSKNFKTSRAIDVSNGEDYSEPVETEVSAKEIIMNADEELLKQLGLDDKEKYQEAMRHYEEEESKLSDYWAFIDSVENNIINVTEEELLNAMSSGSRNWQADTIVTLDRWYNKKDWTPSFGEYCGPNCMAFITLGFGNESGYTDCPTVNNYWKLKALYDTFGETIGTGPKVYSQLSDGLSKLTNFKLEPDFLHFFDTVKNNIDNTGYPSVSLRSSRLFEGWDKLAWHYRVIMGYKYEYPTYRRQFLWWVWDENATERYYIIHDNGTDSDDTGECVEHENTYYHLWSAHVVKK